MEIKVGEKIFAVTCGNQLRNGLNGTDATGYDAEITKVGNKYFTVKITRGTYGTEVIFHKDSLKEKTDYCIDWLLYESFGEWQLAKVKDRMISEIKDYCTYGSKLSKLSHEKIKAIYGIISSES